MSIFASHFCHNRTVHEEFRSDIDQGAIFEFEENERLDKFRPILSSRDLELLSHELPAPLQHGHWKWLYSLDCDGTSFTTLLDKVEGYQFTFLVLRMTKDVVCGGFAAQAWKTSGFYGTGQSFLFSFGDDEVDS